jgi:hypothetical protein
MNKKYKKDTIKMVIYSLISQESLMRNKKSMTFTHMNMNIILKSKSEKKKTKYKLNNLIYIR